jgi:fructoselysine-6-P-deglycase FrlB-like protein
MVSSLHPVVAFALAGPGERDVLDLVAELQPDPVLLFGSARGSDIRLPRSLPESLAVLPAAVRAQQLALALAMRRRLDPDRPPRLKKVMTR